MGFLRQQTTKEAINWFNKNREYIKYLLPQVKYSKKRIRFSISYLLRIQVDNKYLLVKGNRIDQFQPVGGVFKFFPEAKTIFNELGVSSDFDSFGFENEFKDDLRVFVSGKNIINFIKWFDSDIDRESTANREFNEELIETGILNGDNFKNVNFSKVKTYYDPLEFSEHNNCYEIKIAQIFVPRFLRSQEEDITNLMKNYQPNDKYVWVEESLIRTLGHGIKASSTDFRISKTAKWTLLN